MQPSRPRKAVPRAPRPSPYSPVADMIHLLAELIENATMFSPSGTRVEVRADRGAGRTDQNRYPPSGPLRSQPRPPVRPSGYWTS
jgi:hypothetical protein